MESGQSLSTCISRARDEKASGWGLQLCFGLFVLYKMGHLNDVGREARASLVKDLKNLLEAFVTIIVGGFNVVLIYC